MRETNGCVVTDNLVCAYIQHVNVLSHINIRTLIFEAHRNTMERSTQVARASKFLVELLCLLLGVFKED